MNKLRRLESRNQAFNLLIAGLSGPLLFVSLNWLYRITNYTYLGQDQWALLILTSALNLIFFAARKYSSVFLLMSGLEHYTKVIRDVLVISALLTLAIFILNLSAGRSFLVVTVSFLLLYWITYRKILSIATKRGLRNASVVVVGETKFINQYFIDLFGKVETVQKIELQQAGIDLILFHNLTSFDTEHELLIAKLELEGKIVGYISNELKLEGWSGVQVIMGPHLMRIRPFLSLSLVQQTAKRFSDLLISVLILVVLLPALPIFYIWFVSHNGKPFLFRQGRIGQGGKDIEVVKIRTLAKTLIDTTTHQTGQVNWRPKPSNQDLISGGAFLRRWSIDELPQLLSVIKGDMSIIGPRPRLREEVDETYRLTSPVYQGKLRPGITGLWQISGRSLNNIEYSSVLDKYYLDHWSPIMDLQILLKTITAIKMGIGAK